MNIQHFSRVTVILRGYIYLQIRTIVKDLVGSRLRVVEVMMNTLRALKVIERIDQELGDSVAVGAGTAFTYEEAQVSIAAGAAFSLSPTMPDKRILGLCREKDVVSVPGASPPTEIKKSFEDSADIVKVFPAVGLGSRYLSDTVASLGKVSLIVVGGTGTANVGGYFVAGASFAGTVSGISDKQDILNQSEAGIKASIQATEEKLRELEGDL